MSAASIFHSERLELAFAPKPWTFADKRRAEIDSYFAQLKREKPQIWNGHVLLLHRHHVVDGVFSGAYLETDYASFAAWRHWGRPEAGVGDCFGAAAVISADGAVLLGEMAAHTANAGRVYFPCGTPDPKDVVDGCVDLDLSMRRELEEETGLDAGDFKAEPGWTTVTAGSQIAHIKVLRARDNAEDLRARILAALSRQQTSELVDIRMVRGIKELGPAMPAFVSAFLTDLWR